MEEYKIKVGWWWHVKYNISSWCSSLSYKYGSPYEVFLKLLGNKVEVLMPMPEEQMVRVPNPVSGSTGRIVGYRIEYNKELKRYEKWYDVQFLCPLKCTDGCTLVERDEYNPNSPENVITIFYDMGNLTIRNKWILKFLVGSKKWSLTRE